MKDFDFDEIDRAVSTAIGGPTPVNETPAPADNAVPVTVKPSPAPVSPAPAPSPSTNSSEPSPAARRSNGRFMDVVHPSSNMRPTERPAKPVATEEKAMPESEPQTMPDSPFLSDAKVEKRPLGDMPPVGAPQTPLPSELQDDVLKLEASEEPLLPADTQPSTEPDSTDPVEATPEPAPEAQPEPTQGSQYFTTPLPDSIQQQYKELPTSNDQPSGAIFDTEAYHQPITHPTKKKSGWGVVLLILGLIIIGASAGAAVYFFVLPML
jgi:hypothetical protein